ncbi:hypothetical protein GQ600_3874 [Phytophthora cactorum]|nr:hypothetical protein GQ600_3874 [Phytophthora cactorum]
MQDGGPFMMSPMDSAGELRLAKVRACIRKTFGPGGSGRRTKRALEMADEAPTPAKTPRTKLRQRIAKASQLNAETLFFQQFGSSEDSCAKSSTSLGQPYTPPPRPRDSTQQLYSSQQELPPATSPSHHGIHSVHSSLPAPSIANVSQLTRPTRIRTPRKAAAKRGRAGESSAEKALVLRKPRLGGVSARSIDYSSGGASTFSIQEATPSSSVETRASFAFVTNRGDSLQLSASTRFFSRTSPSKFQFSSNATRLFSQRQAPLR